MILSVKTFIQAGFIAGLLAAGAAFAGGGKFATTNGKPAPAAVDASGPSELIESAANIIATLLVIAAVSFSSLILAGVSFLRKESTWPAAIGLCLSLSALVIVVIAVTKL